MLSHPAKVGTLGKRKDREPSHLLRPESTTAKAALDRPPPALRHPPGKDNRLLAGLLAHEFLSQGTLFGRRWEPEKGSDAARPADSAEPGRPVTYAAASYLLRTGAAHVPGVVNPSQLAGWLQM